MKSGKQCKRTACMTMGCPEFDGDSHESSALLSRNDSVVRCPVFPPQIPICSATERYRAGQGENDYRSRSSRLGRPPCGQISICRATERYRAGQAGNENRPRSSRLVSGDSPPNSNLSACWGEAKCIFQNQTCRRALAFRQVLAFSGAGYSLLIRSSSASSWDRDSIS